jgi:hypothetical protein
MKTLFAAAACVLSLAGPARAQEPTPARMQAAAALLEAMHADSLMARTTDEMLRAEMATNPMMAQHADAMRDFFSKYLSWNLVKPRMQRIYAEVYTEDELHQLADFYGTPLGRRMLETLPEIGRRSNQMSQELLTAHMSELLEGIMAAPRPAKP